MGKSLHQLARLPLYLGGLATSVILTSGCGGQDQPIIDTAAFETHCAVCHMLDGTPTPLGPQNVQLGPETCQLVDCSNLIALATYIDENMPPQPEDCVDDCAIETARLIAADFQTDEVGAAKLAIQDISNLLTGAQIEAYDQSTGQNVTLEINPPGIDAESPVDQDNAQTKNIPAKSQTQPLPQ